MAHIKSGGAVKGNKDSTAQRLGVKKFGAERVVSGNIIVRQRGTAYKPGLGVKLGKDDTIYAVRSGVVVFKKTRGKVVVSIVEATE